MAGGKGKSIGGKATGAKDAGTKTQKSHSAKAGLQVGVALFCFDAHPVVHARLRWRDTHMAQTRYTDASIFKRWLPTLMTSPSDECCKSQRPLEPQHLVA